MKDERQGQKLETNALAIVQFMQKGELAFSTKK